MQAICDNIVTILFILFFFLQYSVLREAQAKRIWNIFSKEFGGREISITQINLHLGHQAECKHQTSHVLNLILSIKYTKRLACENIRFCSLFVTEDVQRGGTSATQRQKFHTDDVKSVQNLVRSADWSTEQLHCFSYCLRMTDKRQKAKKVKCKHEESLTKQLIFVEYSLLQKKHFSFAGARGQINTTVYQNRPEDAQNQTNLYLKPHHYRIYYVNVDLRH